MRPQSPPPKPLSLKTPAQCLRYRPPVIVMTTVWYARSRDLRYAAFLQATGAATIHPACRTYPDAGETKLARDSNL